MAPMTEKRPATASRGMVGTNHPLGSAAGAEMLAAGGNAVDAAIGALFALTVVEPMMAGIFGAGMSVFQRPQPFAPVAARSIKSLAPAWIHGKKLVMMQRTPFRV